MTGSVENKGELITVSPFITIIVIIILFIILCLNIYQDVHF